MIRVLRRAYRTTGFALAASGVIPVHAIHERIVAKNERAALEERYKRAWCASMLGLFGIRLHVIDPVPALGDRGRLVVSNHRSAIDIPILFHVFGGRMLSRADIGGWPVLGTMAKKIGTVFVDRTSSTSGAAAIHKMCTTLESKDTLSVFPEGTTFEGDEVRPFHSGGFLAAQRAHAEILPVGIAYEAGSEAAYRDESFLAHLSRVASAPPSRVALAIGAPIDPGVRAKDTAETARAMVRELVKRARASL